jgi:hypothetical protein
MVGTKDPMYMRLPRAKSHERSLLVLLLPELSEDSSLHQVTATQKFVSCEAASDRISVTSRMRIVRRMGGSGQARIGTRRYCF